MNFSTDSYRAEVNATNVVVRVMAFGSFDTPFLVEVVPDVDVDIPESTYKLKHSWLYSYDWTITATLKLLEINHSICWSLYLFMQLRIKYKV